MTDIAALAGHWRRDWLRAPGLVDRETRVHWFQASCGAYVDLRLPAGLPPPARSLAELGPEEIDAWLACEGFAGAICLAGDTCTWTRRVNLHGLPDTADIGLLRWDGADRLHETGLLADYAELWSRQDGPAPVAARYAADDAELHIVRAGDAFAFGIGHPDKPPTRAVLSARPGAPLDALAEHFADEYAIGHVAGEIAVIDASTHPLRRPGPLFRWPASGQDLVLLQPAGDGAPVLRAFRATGSDGVCREVFEQTTA
jgi:hypothetical protein